MINILLITVTVFTVLVLIFYWYAKYSAKSGFSIDENNNQIPDSWEKRFSIFFKLQNIIILFLGILIGYLINNSNFFNQINMAFSFKKDYRAILSVFNFRLLFILVETVLIYFLYKNYKINFNIDFTIMSIAIVFPLVFSITSAYQRRQDAINLFLEFRNKIIDLTNIFYAVEGIKEKEYNELFTLLQQVQSLLIKYLVFENDEKIFDQIRSQRKQVLYLIDSYKNFFNEREKDSLIRIKNELFLSAEKVRGIKIHGTPISLKKYCLIFIYFSPFLYNSQSFVSASSSNIENFMPLFFVLVVSFVLMALYNIQDYIENPFDQEGLDDLKIDNLKVGKVEGLFD